MKTVNMIITPDIAKDMLSHNKNNRNIRRNVVDMYARQMKKGMWEADNPNPIVFGNNGDLKDGQHRLLAVVESGCPMSFLVAYVEDSVSVFDSHCIRTARDYALMKDGEKVSNSTISAVTLHITEGHGSKKISHSEIIEEYHRNSDMWDYATLISRRGNNNGIGRKGFVIVALFDALKSGMSRDVVERFCNVVNSGFAESKSDNCAILARNLLISNTNRTGGHGNAWRLTGFIEEYIRLFSIGSTRTRSIKNPTWCFRKEI